MTTNTHKYTCNCCGDNFEINKTHMRYMFCPACDIVDKHVICCIDGEPLIKCLICEKKDAIDARTHARIDFFMNFND